MSNSDRQQHQESVDVELIEYAIQDREVPDRMRNILMFLVRQGVALKSSVQALQSGLQTLTTETMRTTMVVDRLAEISEKLEGKVERQKEITGSHDVRDLQRRLKEREASHAAEKEQLRREKEAMEKALDERKKAATDWTTWAVRGAVVLAIGITGSVFTLLAQMVLKGH